VNRLNRAIVGGMGPGGHGRKKEVGILGAVESERGKKGLVLQLKIAGWGERKVITTMKEARRGLNGRRKTIFGR